MKNIKSIFTNSLIGQHHDLQPIGSTAVQQISMSPNRQQLAVVESHAGCHIASHADCHNCLTYAVCQPLLFSSLKHRLLMSYVTYRRIKLVSLFTNEKSNKMLCFILNSII